MLIESSYMLTPDWSFLIVLILLCAIVVLTLIARHFLSLDEILSKEKNEDDQDFKHLATAFPLVLFLSYLIYQYAHQLGVGNHILEWFNLIVRWTHVIIGIAWIGASFYFVFLENSLNRTKGLRDELAGNLWAVHGGGFYYLEKYKVAPAQLPDKLHWFKYEAYFTWITGFLLLFIVFYSNAEAMLLKPGTTHISPGFGVTIGLFTLLSGWAIYDVMCKTKLVHNGWIFTLVGFVLIVLISWFLSEVFNNRAAYIHVGALLGTLMAGNVFKVIIPSQKALVAAVKLKQLPDPELGKHAGLRSLHNNYMTLPVVFVMISNHFPSTFGHTYNWLILAGLFVASGLLRHYLNLKEKGREATWILPISTFMILTLAYVTSPPTRNSDQEALPPTTFSEVHQIIQIRCTSCHSRNPTDDLWKTAPNGVTMDTPEEIINLKDKIMVRAVTTQNMPLGNKTNMTQEERMKIKSWILNGVEK